MPLYKQKPVTIEARQVVPSSPSAVSDIYHWVDSNTGSFEPLSRINGEVPWPKSGLTIDPSDGRIIIATRQGPRWVNWYDYIIKGIEGEFYPCNPYIFQAYHTNEDLSEIKSADQLMLKMGRQPTS